MPTKIVKLPHPDTKDATIKISWDNRETHTSIFTQDYDIDGKEYRSDVLLEKAQLLVLLAILTQAYNEMLDETGN